MPTGAAIAVVTLSVKCGRKARMDTSDTQRRLLMPRRCCLARPWEIPGRYRRKNKNDVAMQSCVQGEGGSGLICRNDCFLSISISISITLFGVSHLLFIVKYRHPV